MNKLTINEFITLHKKLAAYHLKIYPIDKVFFHINAHEILKLGNYFPKTCQVITIKKETNEMVDLIPIQELVKNNFYYFREAKHAPIESVDRKYDFIIYETVKAVSEAINNYKLNQRKMILLDI